MHHAFPAPLLFFFLKKIELASFSYTLFLVEKTKDADGLPHLISALRRTLLLPSRGYSLISESCVTTVLQLNHNTCMHDVNVRHELQNEPPANPKDSYMPQLKAFVEEASVASTSTNRPAGQSTTPNTC